MSKFWVVLGVFAMLASFGFAEEMKDPATGKAFPETVTFDGHTLTGTGTATRKKFFVKVYSIASYIEDPSSLKKGDIFEEILKSNKLKQLTIIWVRNIDQGKVQEGFRDALGKMMSNAADIVEFSDLFGAVSAGDKHEIRWMPDGKLTVLYNGKETGSVNKPGLAKDVWSIWFGRGSIVDRDKLVSLIH